MSSSKASAHAHYPDYASSPIGQRKVAIPRLQKLSHAQSAKQDRRRVPRACTGCRSHKIKCTGERPRCKHCANTNRECVYILPRKDRLKIVTERCQQMAGLLRGLRHGASVEDSARIADLLDAVEEDVSELHETTMPIGNDIDTHDSQESRDFGILDHDAELTAEAMDLLDENLHEDVYARATGFVGKNSEIQWLRTVATAQSDRTEDEVNGRSTRGGGTSTPSTEQANSFSYWTDDQDVDVDIYVDPYELPPMDVAERLLQCYMVKVHESFPILPRKPFENQFRVYFQALHRGNAPRLSPIWQAILNLVFAIGAKYAQLVNASWRGDENDHHIYSARARALALNEATITCHSDIPHIQSLGLLAFYWVTVGQISRAWTLIGMALRSAYALGLHVRNEDPTASATKRETLVRTWWSLYTLERNLSILTGRPSIIVDSYCSVPLPIPVTEEDMSDEVEAVYRMRKASMTTLSSISPTASISSSNMDFPMSSGPTEANSGSYFRAVVQLCLITQNILTTLYSPSTTYRSPGELQKDTSELGQRLDQWISALPTEFLPQRSLPNSNDPYARERMLLGFQTCGARILLTRPCLTGRRQPWKETDEASFTRRMANACIDAAKSMIDVLADEARPKRLYDSSPWWCVVHHLMQAIAVFLLAISYPSSTAHEVMSLVYYAKKGIYWLQSTQDPVAQRAYLVAVNSFQTVARRNAIDVSDMWAPAFDPAVAMQGSRMPQAIPVDDVPVYWPIPPVSMASHSEDPIPLSMAATYDAYHPHVAAQAFNQEYYTPRQG